MKIAVVAESEFFNEDLVGFLTHEDQWRRMQDQLVFVFDVEQLVGKLFFLHGFGGVGSKTVKK